MAHQDTQTDTTQEPASHQQATIAPLTRQKEVPGIFNAKFTQKGGDQ
jgi:hypothetical protein